MSALRARRIDALDFMGLGPLRLAGTAAIRAIAHLVPDLFPFLSPCEGEAAIGAIFLRQIGFLAHLGHGGQSGRVLSA